MPVPTDLSELAQIDARARAYADLFQLPLKERTWRGNAGDFMGSGVGSSLDFQDHRNYLPGDDPRHINWQAYARTGNYSMKLYREEVRPMLEIILDVSESLFFTEQKAIRTIELFYFTLYSALYASAATRVFLVNGNQQLPLAPEEVLTHDWTRKAAQWESTESSQMPNLGPLPFRSQSLRILISDLLFPAAPESLFRELTRSKGDAILFCPFLRSEESPDWEGNYEFIDAESAQPSDRRVSPKLLQNYLQAYRRHFETWQSDAIRFGLSLTRVPCEPVFEESLQHSALVHGTVMVKSS